jgi:hypothetical protein
MCVCVNVALQTAGLSAPHLQREPLVLPIVEGKVRLSGTLCGSESNRHGAF